MNPWLTFFIGLFVGGVVGMFVMALAVAVKQSHDEDNPPP